MHNLKTVREHGFGSWEQCQDCGATFHSGYWWIAGYKSEKEPPCGEEVFKWIEESAEPIGAET